MVILMRMAVIQMFTRVVAHLIGRSSFGSGSPVQTLWRSAQIGPENLNPGRAALPFHLLLDEDRD